MSAYYNEHDTKKAQWLRNLIAANVIAPGEVDTRSIKEVAPDDLRGFTQCHFFAGIGVWSYAARRAGWADDRPIWTGSCPCQPWSVAGKGLGLDDERHLWPEWFRLIRECRPGVCFGEQVSNGRGRAWLDLVAADMESIDYAIGPVSAPACGFGAPNIRQRTYFVADAEGGEWGLPVSGRGPNQDCAESERRGEAGSLAHADSQRERRGFGEKGGASGGCETTLEGPLWQRHGSEPVRGGAPDEKPGHTLVFQRGKPGRSLGDSGGEGLPEQFGNAGLPRETLELKARQGAERAGPSACNGFWADAEWIWCRDGKYRPIEPGTFPLVAGAPARVLRVRAYGDAINAEQAAAFIRAYREIREAA